MLFGVLSAIAIGIGVTATAQDLMDGDGIAGQDRPEAPIEEVRQDAEKDLGEWTE